MPDSTTAPNLSFPRQLRLLKGADFKKVFAKARRSRDEFFTVLCRSVEGSEPRLGLAISKKELKRSVDRNRVKRLVRESFRLHQHELKTADYIVMSRKRAAQMSNAELLSRLEGHWQRLSGKSTAPRSVAKAAAKPARRPHPAAGSV